MLEGEKITQVEMKKSTKTSQKKNRHSREYINLWVEKNVKEAKKNNLSFKFFSYRKKLIISIVSTVVLTTMPLACFETKISS